MFEWYGVMGVMVIMGVMGVSPIKIGRSCNDSVPGRERGEQNNKYHQLQSTVVEGLCNA